MGSNLYELQRTLRHLGIIISFSGHFTQGIIEEMSEAIRKHLESQNASKSGVYNVISVFVEQTQNIRNYATFKQNASVSEQISQSGIVIIGKNEDGFFVSSGNLVLNEDIPALESRLREISGLDKSELKRLYKVRMRSEVQEGATGAGLGIVDMARKVSKPLEHHFAPFDERYHFFSLKAVL